MIPIREKEKKGKNGQVGTTWTRARERERVKIYDGTFAPAAQKLARDINCTFDLHISRMVLQPPRVLADFYSYDISARTEPRYDTTDRF